MIKKIIINLTIIFSIITPTFSYANEEVGVLAKNWFWDYSKKISLKYTNTQEIVFFKAFSEKVSELLSKKSFTNEQIKLISDLIKLSNEYVFKLERFEAEKSRKIILKTNPIVNEFKYISYNKENIFLENWIWYFYKFESYLSFPNWSEITKKDLDYNWINPETDLVFLKDDNKLWFVTNYTKVKLISDSIIYWITNKYSFLNEIKDDKKKIVKDTDQIFLEIKNQAEKLSYLKNKEDKIKNIYAYILENIKYSESFSLSDYEIYSWTETFNNKEWVCEWYTKIFVYMSSFSWIWDVELIRWYVIDAQDFPEIWHAWIRIWDYYYDPTFDDPIGQKETREFKYYFYYKLAKDLFYTNRYNYNDINEEIKNLSKDQIQKLINSNIAPLVYKYKYSWYNILKPFILKLENNIELDKVLDINDLWKIIWEYEVNNFTFYKNWIKKSIKSLKYYKIDDSLVEDILKVLNYNTYWYYLFKWKLENWTYEYRLWYDLIFN